MASQRLRNYLRTHRKRMGLTQDEMAFLLGCQSGAKVSRYERFARQPCLHTIFLYEAFFGVPAKELFAGEFQKAERLALGRLRFLMIRLERKGPFDPVAVKKLESLRAIGSRRN